MGQNIKSLRTRIHSVDSTQHLTKAMGLVASSKMRRANQMMGKSREYARSMDDVVQVLISSRDCGDSPYLKPRAEKGIRLIVIAGDRGLAGGYNNNVFKLAGTVSADEVIAIGKRACERWRQPVVTVEGFSAAAAAEMAEKLCEDYREGRFSKLGILYTRCVSMMSQVPEIRWILPLHTDGKDGGTKGAVFEPDERTVLDTAVPLYVTGVLTACLRESFASEIAARRMAMDSADKNAAEMIAKLQLQYNRARQNSITQELTEIVAGSGL